MTTYTTTVSPLECRVLSELALHPNEGLSPKGLSDAAEVDRACIYAIFQRLRDAKMVKAERAGAVRSQVRYIITPKGIKAREAFAREVGLRV